MTHFGILAQAQLKSPTSIFQKKNSTPDESEPLVCNLLDVLCKLLDMLDNRRARILLERVAAIDHGSH